MNVLEVMKHAEDRDALAILYTSMSEEYGRLLGEVDTLWLEKRAAHPDATDKFIDKIVGASEIGKRLNYLKYTLKGYDKRISSLNTIIQVANNEAKNLY